MKEQLLGIVAGSALSIVALSAPVAAVVDPVAGCPPEFTLEPDIIRGGEPADHNGDDCVCVKLTPNAPPGHIVHVIDNSVPLSPG